MKLRKLGWVRTERKSRGGSIGIQVTIITGLTERALITLLLGARPGKS